MSLWDDDEDEGYYEDPEPTDRCEHCGEDVANGEPHLDSCIYAGDDDEED
jgi:hypothetical protein